MVDLYRLLHMVCELVLFWLYVVLSRDGGTELPERVERLAK